MEKIKSLRGMRDILPPEIYSWQFVEQAARETFDLFGYEEVRTPLLEEAALFRRSVGDGTDIVNKEMYVFTDQGGRTVALRPEGTAPIARACVENDLLSGDAVLKFYYIGAMFRSERPQKGRNRQFYQVGLEAIGSSSPYVDAEVILAMTSFFDRIELRDFKIKLSCLGCAGDKEKFADKLKEYLKPESSRLCDNCKIRLGKNPLRVLDCKTESCNALAAAAPKSKDFLCSSCAENYSGVKDILSFCGVKFCQDDRLVRGLDYYTGTVFEVTHPALGSQDAIAAGGRYDNLIKDFGGKSAGAFGFAAGVDRLLLALPSAGSGRAEKASGSVYIAVSGEDMYPEAFKAAVALRRNGISCTIDFPGRSLKAQLRQADKKNAAAAAIFGSEEFKKGEAALRDMKTSEQRNVKLDKLPDEIRRIVRCSASS